MEFNSFSDSVSSTSPTAPRLSCRSRRYCRMGLFASTPFIGPDLNNFSHNYENVCGGFCRIATQSAAIPSKPCPDVLQPLSRCDAVICLETRQDARWIKARTPWIARVLRLCGAPIGENRKGPPG